MADLLKAGPAEQLEIVDTETRCEVRGRLDAPSKVSSGSDEAIRNQARAVQVDEKVVVDNPEQLQTVASREVHGLFYKLIGGKRIPFAAVDTGVGAIGAVVGASEA